MQTETLGGLRVTLAGGTDYKGGGDGPVVVLLHGFGAPGDDLVQLWRALDAPRGTRFVFPTAPLALGREYGPTARAWWLIDMMRLQMALAMGNGAAMAREVPEGLASARASVTALLEELGPKLNARPEHVVLGGFSQGAMLSLDVALHTSQPLAGLVLMSGTLLAEHEWVPLMPERKGLPVLQSHGREDPLLMFSQAEALRDRLTTAGLPVEWVPFRGGHGIPESVLTALNGFLRKVLPGG